MDGHAIHRLHAFIPHLASRQPDLLALLPEEERPEHHVPLAEWALALPQRRLMEICSAFVLESLRRLKERSPLTNVLLRGCLHLSGEFDISDAAAVAVGETAPPGDPRRDEIRYALNQAARMGVLIHLPDQERYCIPFPVRLSFEGVNFVEPLERDQIRYRMVQHFGGLAEELADQPELSTVKYWRFSNLLSAYEAAVEQMEDMLGLEPEDWVSDFRAIGEVPDALVTPLIQFGRFLGRALVHRQSESGARLLAASIAAAATSGNRTAEAAAEETLGQFYLRRGAFTRAIESYRHCERVHELAGNPEGVVLSISAIALAHREMGNSELAISEFVRACDLARLTELAGSEIDTANCAVRLLLESDRNFEAIQLLTKVMDSQKKSVRRCPAFAELQVLLGTALRLESRFDEARDRLFGALGVSQTFAHRPAEAQACLELGILYAQQQNWDECFTWIRRARSLFAEISDYSGQAKAYLALSRALLESGDQSEESEELLVKALRGAQLGKDMGLLAAVWRERGLRRLHLGDRSPALGHFHQEIKALRHTRDIAKLVDAHLRIGELYLGEEAYLAAGTEVLRAQGLARCYLHDETPKRVEELFVRARSFLTQEQFEYLVQEVTDELEGGELK